MPDETTHAQTAAQGTDTAAAAPAPASDTTQADPASGGAGAAVSLKDAVTKALNEDDDGAPAPTQDADAPAAGDDGEGDADADEADDGGEGGEGDDAAADAGDPDLVAPEGISTKARERFDKLVDRVKASDQRATTAETNFQQIESTLKNTGASPEDWGKIIVAMQYANSGDPQQARHALEILDGFRASVARVAGVPIQGTWTRSLPLSLPRGAVRRVGPARKPARARLPIKRRSRWNSGRRQRVRDWTRWANSCQKVTSTTRASWKSWRSAA